VALLSGRQTCGYEKGTPFAASPGCGKLAHRFWSTDISEEAVSRMLHLSGKMRVSILFAILLFTQALTGCQATLTDARSKLSKCYGDIKSTPEAQMLALRVWQFDGSDRASKLTDLKPLTPAEREALEQVHNKAVQCRQVAADYDNLSAAWQTPIKQDSYQRTDQIIAKLASGEISVGAANRLFIESNGKLQGDLSKDHADAVSADEAKQQRAAEAMLHKEPRMTTTNCSWLGNNLNCTSTR
jgi:hypothetical protein